MFIAHFLFGRYFMKKIALIALLLCAACADMNQPSAPPAHGSSFIYSPGTQSPPVEAGAFIYDANAPVVRASAFLYASD
jgi:hypothetical protein